MDNVIDDLQGWLNAYNHETDGYKDLDAINCIKKALAELDRYYTDYEDERLSY